MDFSIGTSSGSSLIENSGSEEDLQALTKRRRTISDPESARRSRLRKKKHLEDLMYQIGELSNRLQSPNENVDANNCETAFERLSLNDN
ncbi:bZIP transcription factor 11-like [Tripterygium wilfordii]|uniref:bZIP transcription factor 11-like n=1 Tax=Tripterygium wilfordii TaxID=458696 RepID=UPI0018F85F97|nr:bZIP transcription factor 11-like [Tripterygium wilfordii]